MAADDIILIPLSTINRSVWEADELYVEIVYGGKESIS